MENEKSIDEYVRQIKNNSYEDKISKYIDSLRARVINLKAEGKQTEAAEIERIIHELASIMGLSQYL